MKTKYIAAITPTNGSGYKFYPPYLNIGSDGATVTVTLRGNEFPDGKCGATDTATFPEDEFRLFLTEAAAAFGAPQVNMRSAMSVNDLEQRILAAVRRAHDEFALNGFEGMAATMTMAEREVRDLAVISRKQSASLRNLTNDASE